MKISCIIPAYNSKTSLAKLLDALFSFKDRPDEIIVVDDGSKESLADLAQTYPIVLHELGHNFGAGYARNYGARKAKGDIYLFIDTDVIPKPNYLEVIREELVYGGPEIGGCGGRYIMPDEFKTPINELSHFHENLYWSQFYPRGEVGMFYGGLCAFKKEAWFTSERSFLEHKFFRHMASGEDTLVCQEIHRKFKLIYRADLEGYHYTNLEHRWFKRSMDQAYSRASLILTKNVSKIIDKGLAEHNVDLLAVAYLVLLAGFIHPAFFLIAFFIFIYAYRILLLKSKIGVHHIARYALLQQAGWVCGLMKISLEKIQNFYKPIVRLARSGWTFLFGKSFNRIYFFVTNRCNFACSWCLDGKRPETNTGATANEELSIEEIERITTTSKNKIPYMVLTGGEPFLRNDIYKIVLAFYKNSATRFMTINTNGSFPEKLHEHLEKILILCPELNINLQLTVSETKNLHDQIRARGSYDSLIESKEKVKALQKNYPNLIFTISTQIESEKIERFPDVIKAVKEDFGPDEHFISLIRQSPDLITKPVGKLELMENYVLHLFELYSKKRNVLQSLYNFVILHAVLEINNIRLGTARLYSCAAGKKFISLYENGNILPCENRQDLVSGNIRNFNYDLSSPAFLENLHAKYLQQKSENCQCDWGCAVSQNLVTDPAFMSKAVIKSII